MDPFATAPVARPATDRQIALIAALTEDRAAMFRRAGDTVQAAHVESVTFDHTIAKGFDETSKLISTMIAANRELKTATLAAQVGRKAADEIIAKAEAPVANPTDAVIAGRYAVEDPADGVLKFYVVDRPTEGRWAGWVFVSVQASDEEHRIRGPRKVADILERILAAGVGECSRRYGREIGSCGVCGRTLTNEASRAEGIGPVCAAKLGI
jgi:hypothetical protein